MRVNGSACRRSVRTQISSGAEILESISRASVTSTAAPPYLSRARFAPKRGHHLVEGYAGRRRVTPAPTQLMSAAGPRIRSVLTSSLVVSPLRGLRRSLEHSSAAQGRQGRQHSRVLTAGVKRPVRYVRDNFVYGRMFANDATSITSAGSGSTTSPMCGCTPRRASGRAFNSRVSFLRTATPAALTCLVEAKEAAVAGRRRNGLLAPVQRISAWDERRFHSVLVADELILVEHAPNRRRKTRQLAREPGIMPGGVRKRPQFLANEIVERVLDSEAPLDRPRGAALLDPDFLEPHHGNMGAIPPLGHAKVRSTRRPGRRRRPRVASRQISLSRPAAYLCRTLAISV